MQIESAKENWPVVQVLQKSRRGCIHTPLIWILLLRKYRVRAAHCVRIFAHAHNGTLPSPFFPPHWFQEEANNQWVAYARAKKKSITTSLLFRFPIRARKLSLLICVIN